MYRRLIYSLSLVLLLSIPTYQAEATYPFLQDPGPNGIVSMEAENYDNTTEAPDGHFWKLVWPASASGSKAMQALPNSNTKRREPYGDDGYLTYSPRLDFKVSFVKTGTHYIWVRGHANGWGGDDDCHAGLNYLPTSNGEGEQINFNATTVWGWFNLSKKIAGPATLSVPSAGIHTVNIWMCEDGAIVDKIVLTTNPAYTPSGEGPPESGRVNPLSVDDFENYSATTKIFETWIPGSGTGATIGHPASPYVEQTIVHSSSKSMPYYYDNNKTEKAYYSEAEADTSTLGIGPDWTKEGAKSLTLHFYGNMDNDANAAEQMYVALKDDANKMAVVYYDGDPNDVRDPNWHEWNIRLKDFTDTNNVNLSNIKKVYIGFGNRYNHPTPGGKGIVYFDDIRLYPTRCVPGRVKGNFNDDCVVDYADLEIMTADWLNDYQFADFALLAESWLEEIFWP